MNFAIIGTNFITDWFLEAGSLCPDFNLTAVYSRTLARAKEYATQYGAKYVFDSLDDICNCDEIKAVYIASPASCHYGQAIKFMSAKKHVLCEKPIASNSRELESMLKQAKENNVVLLEAMRPAFSPVMNTIESTLPSLGKIRHAYLTFSKYSSRYDRFMSGEPINAFDPDFSNSALTDLGCYCVFILLRLFGKPKKIQSTTVKLSNGYDALGSFIASYDNMSAVVSYSKVSDTNNLCEIQGEDGMLQFKEPSNLEEVYLIKSGQPQQRITTPMIKQDMVYELQAFINYTRNPNGIDIHHNYSRDGMSIMDEVRKQCNSVFLADNE